MLYKKHIAEYRTSSNINTLIRYKAAQKLGIEKVPVQVAKDLTDAQLKAYRIADNQTATLADWNYELLPIELKDLQGMDFDLDLLGFGAEELGKLLEQEVAGGLSALSKQWKTTDVD